jgi:Ca2+:H+ antiporter
VARRILWASLALTPVALLARHGFHTGATATFVLAALALIPLAWLIGEATEHAAAHTGPGPGSLLNASFGNAPELIIAIVAVAHGLPEVVRGTITGSVVSNLLLVLGAAMIFGGGGRVDTRSLRWQLTGVAAGLALFLVPSIPGWHDSPNRHSLMVLTVPVALVLLVGYIWITVKNLRVQAAVPREAAATDAWSLKLALAVLGAATIATAFVSEELVQSLHAFGQAVGLGEFFIAVVIVAIVGNAAEHGGAVVIARRGNTKLATEIAISSSMQVAVLLMPAVTLLSWIIGAGLPLSFRVVEVLTMALAAAVATIVVWDGRSRRWEGAALVGTYALCVVWYALA